MTLPEQNGTSYLHRNARRTWQHGNKNVKTRNVQNLSV